MNAIRIRKQLQSDTLHLPELRPWIGKTVEIVITEQAKERAELSEEEYQQLLVDAGLLDRVQPRPPRDAASFDQFQPVKISGKPLSETIIEERR
jgi:hypothetical protein